jgi:hypothetical protein
MTCQFENLDAAYVLGSLAPAERADYERHLSTCEECSRSVRELAGLPGLLARVPADVLEPSAGREPVPETLLPALVAAAERHQRRRTIRASLLAAAAVAVIAVGSAVAATALDDDKSLTLSFPSPSVVETTSDPQLMTAVGDGTSTGWVSLTPVPSGGTRADLTCTYNSSYGGAHDYRLVVFATNGRTASTTFTATTGVEKEVPLLTSFDLDEIEKVVVKGDYGPILLLNPVRTS